jgi:hypothetical protein
MTALFRKDPVQVQKGRVLEAVRQWREAYDATNDKDALPQDLTRMVDLATRIANPVRDDIVTSIDALLVEFESLLFVDDPEENLRGVEEKTLLLQAALGNLRRGAARAGYAVDDADDASLPPGLRLPRSAIADKLDALVSALEEVKASVSDVKRTQEADRSNEQPIFQGPLVNNTFERINIKFDLSLLQIQRKLIDVSGLVKLVGETRSLIRQFLTSVSQLGLKAGSWLLTQAETRVKPAARELGSVAGAVVRKAAAWFRNKQAPSQEPVSVQPEEKSASGEKSDEPPDDFDIGVVKQMILRGEAPPSQWVPWITELSFHERYYSAEMRDDDTLDDLTPLAGLTELRSLYLDGCNVRDLSPLGQLEKLESLDLSNTPSFDLAPLAGLSALQELDLQRTKVADLSPLANLSALHSLWLRDTQVTDLSPLREMENLEKVYVSEEMKEALESSFGRTLVIRGVSLGW